MKEKGRRVPRMKVKQTYFSLWVLISSAIHLCNHNGIDAFQMHGKLVVGWFQGLTVRTPRGIDLTKYQTIAN